MLSAFPSSPSPLVWNLLGHSKPPHLSPTRGLDCSQASSHTAASIWSSLPSLIPDAGCLWACWLFRCPEPHTALPARAMVNCNRSGWASPEAECVGKRLHPRCLWPFIQGYIQGCIKERETARYQLGGDTWHRRDQGRISLSI